MGPEPVKMHGGKALNVPSEPSVHCALCGDGRNCCPRICTFAKSGDASSAAGHSAKLTPGRAVVDSQNSGDLARKLSDAAVILNQAELIFEILGRTDVDPWDFEDAARSMEIIRRACR